LNFIQELRPGVVITVIAISTPGLSSRKQKSELQTVEAATESHRMAWVGRDLKDHESPTPLPGRATNLPIY